MCRSHVVVLPIMVALLGSACGGPPREHRHLEDIEALGELRVVVRPGFSTISTSEDAETDEAQLLRQLAARLDARLRWLPARRGDQVLRWLHEGRADIAVARFAPTDLEEEGVVPSAAVEWVEDLLIARRSGGVADPAKGLDGRVAYVVRSELREPVRASLERAGVRLRWVPEEVPLEEVAERVRIGRYDMTVVDSAVLDRVGLDHRLEVVSRLGRRQLVWAMSDSSPYLRRAVDGFLFAEQVLRRSAPVADCRDLDGVRAVGALRLLTRNSPTTCTVDRGGLGGFEYQLARDFAHSLGLRLELVIPPPGQDPLNWLEEGYGDMAALHEPADPVDANRFLVSPPYRRVDLVSVHRSVGSALDVMWDLAGRRVAAPRAVASLVVRFPLDPPPKMVDLEDGADGLVAIRNVARGDADVAVVDADIASIETGDSPLLEVGPVIVPDVGLVWIFNRSAPSLSRRASDYLEASTRDGVVRQLVFNTLGSWRPPVSKRRPDIPDGALSPFDEVLEWVGRQHGLDWRLLASLMYEESRFDPDAVGPGGSSGLFQFMPFTWQELGVEDPHHPAEAAEAGARYLRRLMDMFSDVPLSDQVAMAIASYNVGPGHIFDARKLAAEIGYDPNRWDDNVEAALLLLDNPEVARRFPSGVCKCKRAVGYTRRILRRYHAYAEQFPPG